MTNSRIKLTNVGVDIPVYDFYNSRSLKKTVISQALSIGGIIKTSIGGNTTLVQALKDINLDIKHGERLSIIGHNGAGKSTLLRVLCGIYEPTYGEVDIRGRIVPIFDLGMGMDMDCNAIDNVYLRSLYLGEDLQYSQDMVDDVIEFADLGDFAYMPLRTYSSGMLARLQFGITTSMRPDILVMDESIGAGDAAFFERAQIRLDNMLKSAGIMVLATHSEGMSRQMTDKCILMEKGRIVDAGTPEEVWTNYHKRIAESG